MNIRKELYIRELSHFRLRGLFKGPIILLTILLCLSSCIKEEFKAEQLSTNLQINPGIATPIGWARYQMDEILYDSLNPDELYIDENGFMFLIYSMDPFSVRADEIIDIQNLQPTGPSIDNPFGVTTDLDLLPEAYTFDTIVSVNLPIEGTTESAIDSILVRYGEMTLSVSAPDYPEMIWSARILIDGVPDWQATLDDIDNSVTDTLEGITLPLDNTVPNSNALRFNIIVTLWDTLAVIEPGPILDINISLMDLDYSAIYGYLGSFDINIGPETFDLDFINDMAGGSFTFADPRLTINFQNSFGLPIHMDLADLYATEIGGNPHFITPTGGGSFQKDLLYPVIGEEGSLVADSLVINKDNSNLAEVLSEPLSTFNFHAIGTANPNGPPGNNFILDNSILTVSTDLVLPLEGMSDTISIADTLHFVFREYFDNPPEEIQRLIFSVTYVTQFPVDVKTQAIFLDENTDPLDYLFVPGEELIIPGAELDGNGVAIPSEPLTIEVELTREQINNIADCHYIKVIGEVITSGNGIDPVRFYDFYFFDTDIAVIAELKLNSDDF